MRKVAALVSDVLDCVLLRPRSQTSAQAQTDDYPTRTVTFICPFPAGGGTDILTRLLAAELQDKLGKPVIVDNRAGRRHRDRRRRRRRSRRRTATRFSGAGHDDGDRPEHVYKTLPYDTLKDFAPVGLVGSAQFALVANPRSAPRRCPS